VVWTRGITRFRGASNGFDSSSSECWTFKCHEPNSSSRRPGLVTPDDNSGQRAQGNYTERLACRGSPVVNFQASKWTCWLEIQDGVARQENWFFVRLMIKLATTLTSSGDTKSSHYCSKMAISTLAMTTRQLTWLLSASRS
jgi:hypothetical protein